MPSHTAKNTAKRTAKDLPPFEFVIETHGPAVLRFCAARAGAAQAEDCFQETMLSALRAYESVRDPAAIRSWLFSIASRKAVDSHRLEMRAATPVEDIVGLAGSREMAIPDQTLYDQVAKLPEKQRHAVTLRFIGDLSHREVAEVMEVSEEAARRNVADGLKRIRQSTGSLELR